MNKLIVNQLYYFGDVNPEHGGVICRKLENGSIEAFKIAEYSPINFCNYICRLGSLPDRQLRNTIKLI